MRLFLYISLLLLSNAAFAKTTNHSVMLGETKVTIQHIKYGEGKEFVHVHQNENTALLAAKKYIKKYGGSIVTLKHHGTRNITFNMHNTRYEFDPNRIYTDIGIKNTLKNYGEYSLEAHQAVKNFAQQIVSLLPSQKVIAIHNNNGYSLHDYLPGHSLEKDAKLLNVCKDCFYRNFFLVTQKQEHYRLVKQNFNSILQADTAVDDGSLSIRLNNKNYINIEAGYNQLAEQFKMIINA